jgi:hypothetical protein
MGGKSSLVHSVHKIGNAHTGLAKKVDGWDGVVTLVLLIIVFGIFVFIKRKSSVGKGGRAENFVSRNLLQLDPLRYKVLNNIMLPSNGKSATTQIDHIVISNHGIFCIETKSHKGWIFGNAYQESWTQVIYRYKGRFYNPLWQNYAHTKAIEDLLGTSRLKRTVVSLVAFPFADKLKVSGTDSVGWVPHIVRRIESHIEAVFSDAERDEIYNLLAASNISDEESRKLHIRTVRDLKKY